MTTQAPDALRLVPVSLIADTMNWMARAYERIHGLPRISDTDLADKVGAAKERLRPYLDAPAVQPAAGFAELFDGADLVAGSPEDLESDAAVGRLFMKHRKAILAAISTPARASETGGEAIQHLNEVYQHFLSGDLYEDYDLASELLGKMRRAIAALSAPQAAPGEGEQS